MSCYPLVFVSRLLTPLQIYTFHVGMICIMANAHGELEDLADYVHRLPKCKCACPLAW